MRGPLRVAMPCVHQLGSGRRAWGARREDGGVRRQARSGEELQAEARFWFGQGLCEDEPAAEPALEGALPHALADGVVVASKLLAAAHLSLDFYDAQLQGLNLGVGAQECSICIDDVGTVDGRAILPCSHVFHAQSIRA